MDCKTKNHQEQRDEIQALLAIYGDRWKTDEDGTLVWTFKHDEFDFSFKLTVNFPDNYPSNAPPNFTIFSPCMKVNEMRMISKALKAMWQNGSVVIYEWTEYLEDYFKKRNYTINNSNENPETYSSSKPCSSGKSVEQDKPLVYPTIHSGEPLTDRKSTFQAHVAVVKSKQDVENVIRKLLENSKIARATHNMFAYRIQLSNESWMQDCDDDGEKHAGSVLMHILQTLDVRDVLVVVSRWYGGIQLGSDRFKHISNVARSVLQQEGFLEETKKSKKK
ncbi:Protein IMPACT-B [Trichinella patagoniensis]|uniref:Protein IMPACT-B n=1 Tax=Trichinella patagoniensis TaxID=990121 RepID=A0A0V0ZKB2_9BILA|nr:Protein IMPACT-B [Trichinella patagoniensis]